MRGKVLEAILFLAQIEKISVTELAKALNTSPSNAHRILQELKALGLVYSVEEGYAMERTIAMMLNKLREKYPVEIIFKNSNLKVLCAAIKPRTIQEIAEITGLSEMTVRKCLSELSLAGLVEKKDGCYEVCNDPVLKTFFFLLSNLMLGVEEYATVLYSDASCVIKAVPKGYKAKGSLTAFSLFQAFGVKYETPHDYYVYPSQRIGIEEVIVHSLVVAKTKDERTIIALLYAKNYDKVDREKLRKLASRFKVLDLLTELERYLQGEFSSYFLPRDELERLADLYSIDIWRFLKARFSEEVLQEIGNCLEAEAKVLLIGGGAMVLRGMKGMTVDVDIIALSDEDLELIREALKKLGYSEKRGNWFVFEREDGRIDVYKKKIPRRFAVTKGVIERADLRRYGGLYVYIASPTDIFIMKAAAYRPKDLEDLKILVRGVKINWKTLVEEVDIQDKMLEEPISHRVLWAVNELESLLNVRIPYKKKLKSIVLKNVVPWLAERGYSVKEISRMLGLAEAVVRRRLKEVAGTSSTEAR